LYIFLGNVKAVFLIGFPVIKCSSLFLKPTNPFSSLKNNLGLLLIVAARTLGETLGIAF
jgi:hypothetical protein